MTANSRRAAICRRVARQAVGVLDVAHRHLAQAVGSEGEEAAHVRRVGPHRLSPGGRAAIGDEVGFWACAGAPLMGAAPPGRRIDDPSSHSAMTTTQDNGIFSVYSSTLEPWLSNPTIKDDLLKGVQLATGREGSSRRLRPANVLTGKGPSNRHEIFYFAEGTLGAVRIDDGTSASSTSPRNGWWNG